MLVSRGVTPRKSKNIVISNENATSVPFWRGMIDGDGGISTSVRQTGTIVKSIYLCGMPHVMELFKSFVSDVLGIPSNAKVKHISNTFATLVYGGYGAVKIMHMLYDEATIYLSRKQLAYTKIIEQLITQRDDNHIHHHKITETLEFCGIYQ
jgi:hypothetical protein